MKAYFVCLRVNTFTDKISLTRQDCEAIRLDKKDDFENNCTVKHVRVWDGRFENINFKKDDFNVYWLNEFPKKVFESKIWLTNKRDIKEAIEVVTASMDGYINEHISKFNLRIRTKWKDYWNEFKQKHPIPS